MPQFQSVRLTYLIAIIYIKRNWQMGFTAIVLVCLITFLQIKFDILQLNKNTISEGLVGTYQEHDLPVEVTNLLSQGLVIADKNGRMFPNLVSDWKVNDDATVYTFKLKPDLKWVDGSLVKTQDLEFIIPNTDVNLLDDQTVEFKLKESYSAFPSLLTKPIFKKNTLIGTGPYKISKIEKSRIFITKIIMQPTINLPKVIIRFYPNEKTATVGFALGEVQSLLGVGYKKNDNPLVKLSSKVDYTKIVTIFYNINDPVLSNRSLRQALSFAAPQIENEVEANNPYPPTSWAYNKDVKDYLNKPDDAKDALIRAKSNSSPELLQKEIVLTTTPQLEDNGKKIIAAWRALGINAVLRVESGIPQKFQALLITQTIPEDPDQYFLWHESQEGTTNLTKYKQKRVDKDLEDGRKLKKEDDRKEKYFDFQKILLEDTPATFMYFPNYNIYFLRKVETKLNQILPLQLKY